MINVCLLRPQVAVSTPSDGPEKRNYGHHRVKTDSRKPTLCRDVHCHHATLSAAAAGTYQQNAQLQLDFAATIPIDLVPDPIG